MAVVLETADTQTFATGAGDTASWAVTKPTNLANDDYVVLAAACDQVRTFTWPSGFVELAQFTSGSSMTVGWAAKKITDAGSEPSSYTVTLSTAERGVLAALRVSGADLTTFLDVAVASTASSGTAITSSSVTTVTDGALVLALIGQENQDTNGWLTVNTAGWTEAVDRGAGAASAAGVGVAFKTQATAGATGLFEATSAVSTSSWGTTTVAIRPLVSVSPHVFFDLTDLPADFGNAETAEITVRTRGVDIGATPLKLFAQIFQSNETTALSDEVEVASHASDSSFANSSPITFTGLNTTADKAVWDAARIRFRWGT